MSDEYDKVVVSGKLKLKTDSDISKKKKKLEKEKLKHKAESYLEHTKKEAEQLNQPVPGRSEGRKLTKAEAAFKQMQDKTQKKRILEKASMTHKQRVEQFNQHLDSLTEHFDIPKVSWTK